MTIRSVSAGQTKPRMKSRKRAATILARGQKAADTPMHVPGATAAINSNGSPSPSAALLAAGKALRNRVPRQIHGPWERDKQKVDPLAMTLVP